MEVLEQVMITKYVSDDLCMIDREDMLLTQRLIVVWTRWVYGTIESYL